MLHGVTIENFKSIEHMDLPLGRVNVLIGENGCGKSNILEAIGFGAAAAANKLDKGDLALRGIRVTRPQVVRSGFQSESASRAVTIQFTFGDQLSSSFMLQNDNSDYGKWAVINQINKHGEIMYMIDNALSDLLTMKYRLVESELKEILSRIKTGPFVVSDFLIYSPQMAPLRALEQDSLVEPLGIHGEGLFRLLQHLQKAGLRDEICRHLGAIDWFEDVEAFEHPHASAHRSIRIRDHYLTHELALDQHSANAGFLFFLFYICLFLSSDTPKFFGIDNVENALSPKLCMRLMSLISRLARENNKQVILTTHSPAILDGLDLKDEEQRLFVVSRDVEGRSRVRRTEHREPDLDASPVRLSEAFMRDSIGGLHARF